MMTPRPSMRFTFRPRRRMISSTMAWASVPVITPPLYAPGARRPPRAFRPGLAVAGADGAGGAADDLGERRGEFGRVEQGVVDGQRGDAVREEPQGVAVGVQAAGAVVDRFQDALPGGDVRGCLGDRGVQQQPGADRPRSARQGVHRPRRRVGAAGQGAGGAAGAVRWTPVTRSARKVRQASRSVSWATRYQRRPAATRRCGCAASPRGAAVGGGVGEADVLAGDAGGGQGRQDAGVGGGRVPVGQGDGGLGEGGDAVPQPGRQDLFEFGQGAGAAVGDAGDGGRGGGAQADGDGDGLLVVQQQRRHRGPGGEPVPAGAAVRGVDGVAEAAEPFDVAADGAGADAQAAGEFAARPFPRGLQQGQQPQQPSGGIAHGSHPAAH
ncbi:hypothetical protein BJF79_42370 [Actinomadura sp. CNU-125]|nr:hypothetical protein BJF79_42370 [Actinomadura sp. CNU-125]